MRPSSDSEPISLTAQHIMMAPGGRRLEQWRDRYAEIGELGSGGQAVVIEVIDKRTGARVALKTPQAGQETERRFRREVEELRECAHRHVMPVLDHGDGWYAMPLAVETLGSRASLMFDNERIDAIDQVAQGLAHAHGLKRCHRDVKPDNILRIADENGERWVIGDFGLVRRPPGQTSGRPTDGVLGTRGFWAPEMRIYGAHHVDHRADVFSLGVTATYLATGIWPEEGRRVQVPAAWSSLIARATAESLEDRLQSMDEVRAMLPTVMDALRQEQSREWARGGERTELASFEIAVLALMLDQGGHLAPFEQERIEGMKPRDVTLGIIGLKRRKLIRNDEDHHGNVNRVEMTDEGHSWALANAHLVREPSVYVRPQAFTDSEPAY